MNRRGFLVIAATAGEGAVAQPAPVDGPVRPPPPHDAVPPQRAAQHERLVAEGEAALARRDTAAAQSCFERAALVLHDPASELGLVRCYLQAGAYRRALAFAAHTAGAHLESAGGAALYAWLLQAGGQDALARAQLQQARVQAPDAPLLKFAASELARPWPVAAGALLAPPARFAPYAPPVPGKVVATGTLVRGGHAVLAPAGAARPGARHWVRTGLGDTVAARVTQRPSWLGLQELLLESPLPDPGLRVAARDPFPGSVAMAIEFALQAAGLPAWPWLKAGFVGAALPQPGLRMLGIAMPEGGARGGPVFDKQGALCGIAINQGHHDRLVGSAGLRDWPGSGLGAAPLAQAADAPMGPDAVYEQGLRAAVQVLRG